MSAVSENVRKALYEKLNVGSVTSLATGGVHYKSTTENLPYLIFQRQTPGVLIKTFGLTLNAEDSLWMVKSYADEDSDENKSPEELNEEILAAAEAAIGNELTLEGGSTWYVDRETDILLPIEEANTDKPVYGAGFLLRVVATP